MKKIVAIVGMAGSGKSEVARVFENHGFVRDRFGDVTDDEKRRGACKEMNPASATAANFSGKNWAWQLMPS